MEQGTEQGTKQEAKESKPKERKPPTSVRVPIVNGYSYKADEVEALVACSTAAGKGSYLVDLFTPQLVDWVRQQINEDVSPDLFAAYMFQQERANELEGKYRTQSLQLDYLSRGLAFQKERADTLQRQEPRLLEQLESLHHSNDFLKDRIEELQEGPLARRNAELKAELDALRIRLDRILHLAAGAD